MPTFIASVADLSDIGGKAKPLKAAKKQAKDFDDDDLAFQEKKRAGTIPPDYLPPKIPDCSKQELTVFHTLVQRRRRARRWQLRPVARALSTPAPKASRRAERNKQPEITERVWTGSRPQTLTLLKIRGNASRRCGKLIWKQRRWVYRVFSDAENLRIFFHMNNEQSSINSHQICPRTWATDLRGHGAGWLKARPGI